MKHASLLLLPCLAFFSCVPAEKSQVSSSTEVPTSSGAVMIALPGGTFWMGTDQGNPDEAPRHEVVLSPFLIDRHEVTHEMAIATEFSSPSQGDPKSPIYNITWQRAKEFCNARSEAEGLDPCYDSVSWVCDFSKNGYRLPTEAEWEYACRAGTEGDYDFGNASQLKANAVYAESSGGRINPVMTKKPNAWGLYGMYGNVAEWCHDVYDASAYARSEKQDPTGPEPKSTDDDRVIRGGSFKSSPTQCRVYFRRGGKTGDTDACFKSDDTGFRCVRRAPAPTS